jgi:hypothetical protein
LLAFAAGCDGQIGNPIDGVGTGGPMGSGGGTGNPGSGPGAGGSMGTTGSGGSGQPPLDCTSPQAPVLHARLLTPSQYDNTVLDMVKVGGDPAKDFGAGLGDDLAAERRANAAATVAHQAALTLAQWSPCVPPQVDAATCEKQLIDRIGLQAYRHPLTASERAELTALFDAGINETKDFATGLEWFLSGVFQSPDLLWQFAKLDPGEMVGQLRVLPPYEIASRLSFFLWDSLPDDALFAAAQADDLGDPMRLQPHLARMLQDPRFLRGVTGFFSGWLRLGNFQEVARDDAGFSTDVVKALQTSLLMSATELYSAPSPNVASLFTGETYYANSTLRGFYGFGGTAADFVATDVAGEERRGILTHPALMALLARPNQTNPIARGLFVRKTVMCQDMPPPPAGIAIPPLAPIAPNLSTRERLDQHTAAPLCASCHNLIDPPGFAFENFDQVGRHRTVEGGKSIDTSGTITEGGDVNGAFTSGNVLLAKLAESHDVKACFAQKYFEYATSRTPSSEDACSLDGLKKSFVPSGDLKELVVTIAKSDSFRYRLSEGGTP